MSKILKTLTNGPPMNCGKSFQVFFLKKLSLEERQTAGWADHREDPGQRSVGRIILGAVIIL